MVSQPPPSPGILGTTSPTPQQGQHVSIMLSTNNASQTQVLELPLNPESITQQLPSRVTTVVTIAGAYQDNWGAGVGRLQIAGVTGWRPRPPDNLDGFAIYRAMKGIHETYQNLCLTGDPSLVDLRILLPPGDATKPAAHNPFLSGGIPAAGSADYPQFALLKVSSDNFQASRSRTEPLLFRYQWEFTILQDLLAADPGDATTQFVPGASGAAPNASTVPPQIGAAGTGTPSPTSPSTPSPPTPAANTPYPVTSSPATDAGAVIGDGTTRLTLAKIAADHGVSVDELRRYNRDRVPLVAGLAATAPVPAGITVFLPGQAWLSWARQNPPVGSAT